MPPPAERDKLFAFGGGATREDRLKPYPPQFFVTLFFLSYRFVEAVPGVHVQPSIFVAIVVEAEDLGIIYRCKRRFGRS